MKARDLKRDRREVLGDDDSDVNDDNGTVDYTLGVDENIAVDKRDIVMGAGKQIVLPLRPKKI